MRPRALVVEDDLATRNVLRAILEGEGLFVDAVEDGESALELLRTEKYVVILLDIVLRKKMSGTDLMHYLQTDRPASLARTVVLTGLNVDEIRKVFPTVL